MDSIAKPSAFSKMVGVRLEFHRTLVATHGQRPEDEQTLKSGIAQRMQFIRRLSIEDANPVTKAIAAEDMLTTDTKKELVGLVNSKVSHVDVAVADAPKLRVRYIENYQSQTDWKKYDGIATNLEKLSTMASRMKSLRIFRKGTDENTFAEATAIALYRSRPDTETF